MNFKIIHVVQGRADPKTLNGVNRGVHSIAEIQKKLGLDVEVWGITKNIKLDKHKHNYILQLFKTRKFFILKNKYLINKLDNLPNKTIFHFHSGFIPEFYFLSKDLKNKNFKWIISPHGAYIFNKNIKKYFIKYFYKIFFEDYIIKNAAFVHAFSNSDYKSLVTTINEKKIIYIPNGINSNDDIKTTYNSNDILKISYCGRLEMKHKGLDLLFKSIKMMIDIKKNIFLDIIGDGIDYEKLKKLANKLKIEKNIKFHHKQFGEDKDKILKASDVFIHASRWDGIPSSVLEAANLAIPIIVSKATNLEKYILNSNSGYIIDQLNENNICNLLNKVIEDKKNGELKIKGVKARNMTLENFNWQENVKLMNENIYKKVII